MYSEFYLENLEEKLDQELPEDRYIEFNRSDYEKISNKDVVGRRAYLADVLTKRFPDRNPEYFVGYVYKGWNRYEKIMPTYPLYARKAFLKTLFFAPDECIKLKGIGASYMVDLKHDIKRMYYTRDYIPMLICDKSFKSTSKARENVIKSIVNGIIDMGNHDSSMCVENTRNLLYELSEVYNSAGMSDRKILKSYIEGFMKNL